MEGLTRSGLAPIAARSRMSDKKIVATLKDMLEYGDFEPVVSVERETTSKRVPTTCWMTCVRAGPGLFTSASRRCSGTQTVRSTASSNSNVRIEIGAAMALYGRNFILLVEAGTTLPSNLQGLYEVRYEGKTIDGTATMNS